MEYLAQAQAIAGEIVTNRRALHAMPELGFDLPQTTAFVWSKLEEMGLEPQLCGPAGITAVIGPATGAAVLLRADMDALPLREESGLPFAATNGNAHACGHDLHTAMLLGAVRLLKANEAALPGPVKLMFQPAEEILEGAKSMIAHGVLEGPEVFAAVGQHVMPLAPAGAVLYNTGAVSASSDSLRFDIRGRGGHGAQPDQTIDPINVAAHLHLALQELLSREIAPDESAVLSVGSIQAGDAHNIIPETALMLATLRTFDEGTRAFLLQRAEEMGELVAQTFRAQAQMTVPAATGSVRVGEAVAATVMRALTAELGAGAVHHMDQRANESEDFAEVSERVPSLFFLLGAAPVGREPVGLHNPAVVFNEEVLPVGAAALATAADALLREQSVDVPQQAFLRPWERPAGERGGWRFV